MNLVDVFTKIILGIEVIKLCKQASETKAAAQQVEQLANSRQLVEAAKLIEKTLDAWYTRPNFWERLLRRLLLNDLLEQLKKQLQQWQQKVIQAEKLAGKAKLLIKKDASDPLLSQNLAEAIALYQRSVAIVFSEEVSKAIQNCQSELQQR